MTRIWLSLLLLISLGGASGCCAASDRDCRERKAKSVARDPRQVGTLLPGECMTFDASFSCNMYVPLLAGQSTCLYAIGTTGPVLTTTPHVPVDVGRSGQAQVRVCAIAQPTLPCTQAFVTSTLANTSNISFAAPQTIGLVVVKASAQTNCGNP